MTGASHPPRTPDEPPAHGRHVSPGRDATRARVYAAELQVRTLFDSAEAQDVRTVHLHGSTITLPGERRFASLESVQAYVDAVLALDWLAQQYPAAARPVVVRGRRGGSRAHYEYGAAVIAVPTDRSARWALRELVVLHELAHHLTPGDGPSHGPEFVGTYLHLVGEVVGPEAELVLRVSMHETGAL